MKRKIDKELRKIVVRSIVFTCFILIFHVVVFFVSAGRLDLYQAWIYFGVVFVYSLSSVLAQAKFSPELLKQRLLRKREGSKLWDEILMRVCARAEMKWRERYGDG